MIYNQLYPNISGKKIILSSKSPRRQQLLADLGIEFEVQTLDVEEIYPEDLPVGEVPIYLAKLKAEPFAKSVDDDSIVITSDTIVSIGGEVLGKPKDKEDAIGMFKKMSGKKHQVITGVCLYSNKKTVAFASTTDVYFKELNDLEIHYYIDNFKPYDKAGAYGIQEWIGYIGIEKIVGSYFNVMGLPVQKLYEELKKF